MSEDKCAQCGTPASPSAKYCSVTEPVNECNVLSCCDNFLGYSWLRFPGFYKEYEENKKDKERRLVEKYSQEPKQADEA